MALTRFLRELRCPIVMLTAILPPSMMETFCQKMFLDRPRVIRDITFRDDIRYALWLQPAQAERDRGEGDDEGDDEKGDSFEDFCVEFIR
jgi:hypothetical protein